MDLRLHHPSPSIKEWRVQHIPGCFPARPGRFLYFWSSGNSRHGALARVDRSWGVVGCYVFLLCFFGRIYEGLNQATEFMAFFSQLPGPEAVPWALTHHGSHGLAIPLRDPFFCFATRQVLKAFYISGMATFYFATKVMAAGFWKTAKPRYTIPICEPWCWNIYQHLPHKWASFVGKYTIHGASGIWSFVKRHCATLCCLDFVRDSEKWRRFRGWQGHDKAEGPKRKQARGNSFNSRSSG